jgi:hypothetical protein
MLAAALYQTVYLLIVAIMTLYMMQQYATIDFMYEDKGFETNRKSAFLLMAFLVFFIGLRPINYVFVDTINYYETYQYILKGQPFEFTWDTDNIIFDNLFTFWGSAEIPIEYFFLMIAVVYFACMFFACKKLFPDDTLLTFLVYLGAFSTFSYGTNGIKAGAAASIFLLAIAYREKTSLAYLFFFMSLGFHHSMTAPIAAFVVSYFIKNRDYFLYGWIACLIMAALHITFFQEIFASYSDEQGASYLSLSSVKDNEVSGFRPDFILYSAIPIFLGDYLVKKYQIESEEYDFIWKVYVATNAVFLLCTYASYINRIAYLSWLLYPIVLIYPFIKEDLGDNQYQYLKYAVYGHLGFTLFMSFVYYA